MEHQRIFVKQFKTGKEVTIPAAASLFDVLKEAQEWRVDQGFRLRFDKKAKHLLIFGVEQVIFLSNS